MRKLTYGAVLLLLISLVGCEKYALDRQMAELCKKDGGVTIYETVTLPRSAFDATGSLIEQDISDPTKLRTYTALIADGTYSISRVTAYISGGEPTFGLVKKGRLSRYENVVQRTSDKKVIAVEISYGRIGGEVSLHHPSSNSCPLPRSNPGLENAVFKKEK